MYEKSRKFKRFTAKPMKARNISNYCGITFSLLYIEDIYENDFK